MTRRTLLKGLTAAPFAAAAGGLLFPTVAEAATIDAGQFRLTSRSANGHGEFADLTAGLATKLAKADATTVIADTNRSATHLTNAPGTVEAFSTGFTWDSGDQAVDSARARARRGATRSSTSSAGQARRNQGVPVEQTA
jgi:hypothetical protein